MIKPPPLLPIREKQGGGFNHRFGRRPKKNSACGGLLLKIEYLRGSKSAAGEKKLKWGSVEQDFSSKYSVSKGFSTAKASQNPQKFPASGRNL